MTIQHKLMYLGQLSECLNHAHVNERPDILQRMQNTYESIEKELGLADPTPGIVVGMDLRSTKEEEWHQPLNSLLSIELQIRAAISEGNKHHIIHYARVSGASSSIKRIAEGREDIVVIAHSGMKRRYEGCVFLSPGSPRINDLHNKTVILDVVGNKERVRDTILLNGNRVIEFRAVVWDDYYGRYVINGTPMNDRPPEEIKISSLSFSGRPQQDNG